MYSATDLPAKIQNKMRIVPNSSKNFSFFAKFFTIRTVFVSFYSLQLAFQATVFHGGHGTG